MEHPAFTLATLGYRIFPCVAKKPLTPSGCLDATSDIAVIEGWREKWPNANWAIATDGLIVVDIDVTAEGGANPWPEDYEKALDLAAAPISLTPSGGKHFFFREPAGSEFRNTVGKLAPNVDTRARGGYVVVAPSVFEGKAYRWLAGELDLRPGELPLPPDWLLEALTGTVRKPSNAPIASAKISAGQRNAALTSMAGYLRRAGSDPAEMFALLWARNQNRCQPPLDEEEVRAIARSVGRYEPHKATTERVERDAAQAATGKRPVLVNLADVQPQPVRWLWPGRIALGTLTMIAGEPGQGKSTLIADIAARVTTGDKWPDDPKAANQPGSVVIASPGSVILLSAEDDVSYTIRPRLDAAGADVSKVTALQGIAYNDTKDERCFSLEEDLPVLEQAIQESKDCRLIVIDPVSSYSGNVDTHKNAAVRGLLAPLSALAARYGVAVVLVTHFSKGENRNAIHAPTGSIAYVAASRAAWAVVADKDDPERRLFLLIKTNLSKQQGGLAFRIVDRMVCGQSVGAVEWEEGGIDLTASDAMRDEADKGPSAVDDASEFLFRCLSNGPRLATDVKDEAAAHMITPTSLRRARRKLGVQIHKTGYQGASEWSLFGQTTHSGGTAA